MASCIAPIGLSLSTASQEVKERLREERALQIRSRPTSVAARAFCDHDAGWQTFPDRVIKLAASLDEDEFDDVLMLGRNKAESHKIMLSAAVQVECMRRKQSLEM